MSDKLDHLEVLLKGKPQEERELIVREAAGYWREPPTIEEFLDQDYWFGHIGPSVYPFLRKQLKKIHPSPYWSPYKEVAFSGAIGGGKSTACEISICYDICCFLCRENPHEVFGFTKGEPLFIALMNATRKGSEDTQIEKIFNYMDQSPFFAEQREIFKKQRIASGKKISKAGVALNLPGHIRLLSGSLSKHAIGKAVLAGMISELNVQSREGGKQAINTYVELKNRLFTRFSRTQGLKPPGKLYLDSSKKEETAVLEQYFKVVKDELDVLLIEAPFWEYVRGAPDKDDFSGMPTFKVFKGSKLRDPFVLTGAPEEAGLPPALIIEVPEKFKPNFTVDCINALRDLAGVATESTGSFITSIEAITETLCLSNPIKNNKSIIYLDMYDPQDTLMEYIDVSKLLQNATYFVHMDFGLRGDRTGIAFTRAVGRTNIERFDRSAGTNKYTQDTIYQTDLVICLKNKPNQSVPIYKIQDFLVTLKKEKGLKFGMVSFDTFASLDLEIRLKKEGFNVMFIDGSVKNRAPYDVLRQTMYERRIKMPYHPILEKEFKELLDLDEKGIDHPQETALTKSQDHKPSKDITDAIAGSVWACSLGSHDVKQTIALSEFTKFMSQPKPQQTIQQRINELRGGGNKEYY
jgi:hypothetical protein